MTQRQDDFDRGLANRRAVLGDAWVERSLASATTFNAGFQDLITRGVWHGVWSRPGLDHRTRRLLVLAMTLAQGRWEEYELHVVHRALVEFVSIDVAAQYADVAKDRLYCDAAGSPSRRAAQVVLYECLRALTTLSAPILAFTAEEIWRHLPKRAGDPGSVHLATFSNVVGTAPDEALAADMEIALAYRELVTKELEPFRAAKHKSTDAHIALTVPAADRTALVRLDAELADLFIVAEVTLAPGDAPARGVTVAEVTSPRCERCWKRVALAAAPADVCVRCASALTAISG